ncbi:MAG: glycosyltransferase family 39 protein [Candidatus Pacebacteria bacterium]|nr:glycosyltransferase family 39 protein [Candidatus Paceibacterota bacterium]
MFKKITSAWAFAALALVCLASFSMMLWASRTDSAIDDELAHIPAGYGYVNQFDYRLNPEHPPLVKALAMFPVAMFVNPVYPISSPAWTTEVNGQWDMGTAFLYNSGNDANAIIFTARIMPILLTILLIILIYFAARRMIGKMWALLPAFLFALDPNVLAHGHYVTTDVGAALGILLSLFFFLKFVESPTTKHLWYAGIAFGIAQLAKFSTPLLVPLFIFLVLVLWLRDMALQWDLTDATRRAKTFFFYLCRRAWKLMLIFVIGYVIVVYPIYFLFTAGEPIARQTADTQQILASFSTGPTPAGQMCHGMRCLADLDITMSKHAITRPAAEYMLGVLMVLQRADGGNTIYFLGGIRGAGGWIYFPVLYLLKEPVPTLIVVLLALVLALWWTVRNSFARAGGAAIRWKHRITGYLLHHFAEFGMASFIVLYWGYSMHSPLNIGIRHLMPTIPLIFILAAVVWKKWIMKLDLSSFDLATIARSFATAIVKYIFLILLLAWLALETLFAAPYFLSYFNEFGGGVWGGYHFVTDSNYDWGQDLLRLQTFVNAHPEIDRIGVDYFGGGNPKYYLGDKEVNWSSSQGNPADQGIHWLAVSVNTLEGAIQPLAPGQSRDASSTYAWLTALRSPANATGTWLGGSMGNVPTPDYRIGTSIFVYRL